MTLEIGHQAPSRSTTHRGLVRNGLVNSQEQQHKRVCKRWAREAPMHLWQLDLVSGVLLVSGREHEILTAIDDHFRFVVAATPCSVFVAASAANDSLACSHRLQCAGRLGKISDGSGCGWG